MCKENIIDADQIIESQKGLIDRLRAELEQVKRERDEKIPSWILEHDKQMRELMAAQEKELSIEREAWDIYDAMYPGVYHNAAFFRKKAQEG